MRSKKIIKIFGYSLSEVKPIFGIAGGNVVGQISRFVFWYLVVWSIVPEKYGFLRYALTIGNFFLIPVASGFPSAITKFISEHKDDEDKLYTYLYNTMWADFLMIVLVSILLLILEIIFPNKIPSPSVLFVVTLGIYYMYAAYVRGLMDVRKIIGFGVIVNIFRIMFMFIFYIFGLHDIIWVLFAYSFPLFFGILYIGKKVNTVLFSKYPSLDFKVFRKIISFAIPIIVSSLMLTSINQIGIIYIRFYLGYSDVAYYTVAKTLSSFIGFIAGAIITLQMPKVSSYNKNKRLILLQTKKYLKFGLLANVMFGLLLYIFSRFIIMLFFPNKYYQSIYILYSLIPGLIFYSLFSMLSATWTGYGKPTENVKISIYGVIIAVVLNFLLIPLFGLVGAGLAYSLSTGTIFFMMYIKLFRFLGEMPNAKSS